MQKIIVGVMSLSCDNISEGDGSLVSPYLPRGILSTSKVPYFFGAYVISYGANGYGVQATRTAMVKLQPLENY